VGTVYKKKLVNDIAPPRQLVPELSERLEQAVLRGMRADRNERQSSVLEFIESLQDKPAPAPAPAPRAKAQPKPAAPAEEPSKPVKSDARAKKRYSSRSCTACKPLQRFPDKTWDGEVLNISEGGLCLRLPRRFEPGSLLTIVLEGNQSARRSLVARVVWVKEDGAPKQWRMGCRFDQPLCEFEVNELA
jgi:hypothetical protein